MGRFIFEQFLLKFIAKHIFWLLPLLAVVRTKKLFWFCWLVLVFLQSILFEGIMPLNWYPHSGYEYHNITRLCCPEPRRRRWRWCWRATWQGPTRWAVIGGELLCAHLWLVQILRWKRNRIEIQNLARLELEDELRTVLRHKHLKKVGYLQFCIISVYLYPPTPGGEHGPGEVPEGAVWPEGDGAGGEEAGRRKGRARARGGEHLQYLQFL